MSRITDTIKRIFGFQSQIQVMVQPSSVMNAGTQVLRAVKPHSPLIKFRAGSGGHLAGHSPVAPPTPTPTPRPVTKMPLASVVTVDASELPLRYRRRPISQEEVDYINRGGPQ